MRKVDLNIEQLAAIEAKGNVLLTACPGSGKTRALTYKIAQELELAEDDKQAVIAITFTNRASDEIKKRIQDINVNTNNLWAGTIHSFCMEWIIRPYMSYLTELKNGYSIADEYKSEELISGLKDSYGLNYWDSVSTKYSLSGDLEELVNIDLVLDYHELLIEEKLIDFDQILHYSYRILTEFPKTAQVLKSRLKLICVDEYQDTQGLQYGILGKILKSKNGTCRMFIVGDADQAIYGSMGGVAKTHEEVEMEFGLFFNNLVLSGNYRSTQKIIDYYRNFQISDIDIRALGNVASDESRITYNHDIQKDVLAEHISELIQERINAGVPMHEICVLAPTWYLIIPMGRKLKSLLPEVSFDAVGLSPLQKSQENVWFKVARLFLIKPSPNNYLIRKRWATELINGFELLGLSLFENDDYRSKKVLSTINSIQSEKEDGLENLQECFESFIDELEIDFESLEQLKLHWKMFFEGAEKRLNTEAFELSRDIESFRRMFRKEEGVVVNTCHGIKGEEFDTLIAFGLLQGKLPNWNEVHGTAADKLLYVICSRAKKQLHLISETGWKTKSMNPYYPTTKLKQVTFNYDN